MAKYLYPDLSVQNYRSLHHVAKYSILSDIITDRLGFKGDHLRAAVKVMYYFLEHNDVNLLKLQKNRLLEKDHFFDKSLTLRQLRSLFGSLKKDHQLLQKNEYNKLHKKEGKKGVYVLLDSDYKKRLDQIVKAEKTTITALLVELIDSKLPGHS